MSDLWEAEAIEDAKKLRAEAAGVEPPSKNFSRTTFFVVGFSKFWRIPIHRIIKELRDQFQLQWLCVSMAYKRFLNVQDLFNGDLISKIMCDIQSQDFIYQTCNCNTRTKVNGLCPFKGNCRTPCAVYEAKCNLCNKSYIGQTQNFVKTRIGQHIGDVRHLLKRGTASDTFASHFASHLKETASTTDIGRTMTCSILWQGNPITAMKTFTTPKCQLCMKERLIIARKWIKNPGNLINSCSEIYGKCRHNPKFHQFQVTGTDELCEKVTICPII